MNLTAVAITGIICITLTAFAIISEVGKCKRTRIQLTELDKTQEYRNSALDTLRVVKAETKEREAKDE